MASSDHFVAMDNTTILVADDDPILREFAAVHLSTPSVEVEMVEDGVYALERLQQGGIDIALIDLEMPRMDGFELISHIRADPDLCHMPLVVVTGREDMMAVDRAYALGATSFVTKPLNWRVLLHQLAYVLKNSRSEASLRQELTMLKALSQAKEALFDLIEREGSFNQEDLINQCLEAKSIGLALDQATMDQVVKKLIGLQSLSSNLQTARRLLKSERS